MVDQQKAKQWFEWLSNSQRCPRCLSEKYTCEKYICKKYRNTVECLTSRGACLRALDGFCCFSMKSVEDLSHSQNDVKEDDMAISSSFIWETLVNILYDYDTIGVKTSETNICQKVAWH